MYDQKFWDRSFKIFYILKFQIYMKMQSERI